MRPARPSPGGFTLIETVITTGILATGLVAVATCFSWSAASNLMNRQRIAATALATAKIEQFKGAIPADAIWSEGGRLNPDSPAAGYFDFTGIESDGTLISSTAAADGRFLRVWQIMGKNPQTATVIVYSQRAGPARQRVELMRVTAAINSF